MKKIEGVVKIFLKNCFLFFTKSFLTTLFFFFSLSLHGQVDLTIIGYVLPGDGLGKIPMTILETLSDEISVNMIATRKIPHLDPVPLRTKKALNNRDKGPGHVALFVDALWYTGKNLVKSLPKNRGIKIAYSMFETTRIHKRWTKILNNKFDAVVVPDPFLVKVYQDSGVCIPIFVLPIPMMLDSYLKRPLHSSSPGKPFVFGDVSANKNPAVLVEAFAKAFGNNSHVHLFMKAGHAFSETKEKIAEIVNRYGLSNVTLEEGFLSLEGHIDLLSSFDCYVNLSRGEGFSFIPREALALGVPVMIANNTASTTICDSGLVYSVPSQMKSDPNFYYQPLFNNENCGKQFDCTVSEVVQGLLHVYNNYETYIVKARKGRDWVKQYDVKNKELREKFCNLVKPKKIVLTESENRITEEGIFTNSGALYKKYLSILRMKP